MTNQNLAPCQAMVSIEDGEPLATQIQEHVDRLPNEALKQTIIGLKQHIDAVSVLLAIHEAGESQRRTPPEA